MANPTPSPVSGDPTPALSNHKQDGLAWREAGPTSDNTDGLPILFLHGLGGSRIAWDAQLTELGNDYRCIAWDMPGYGESDPLDPLTFPGIAAEAVRLLDLLKIERAHIVGLSFGGQQALYLALGHPDRVGQLVLADTSAEFGADGTGVEEWKQLRLAALDTGKTPADLAEAIIDSITATGFAGPDRDLAIAAFQRIPSSGLRAAVHCLPTNDARPRLGEIEAKTLVIIGEYDQETPLAYSEILRDEISDAELQIIPGIGHLTPNEGPSAFNQMVRAFLPIRNTELVSDAAVAYYSAANDAPNFVDKPR